jgi:hypothetical protein
MLEGLTIRIWKEMPSIEKEELNFLGILPEQLNKIKNKNKKKIARTI